MKVVLSILLGAILTMLSSQTVSAGSHSWYSGGNPPADYLVSHMIEGAISADLETTTPGEYCNYYNTGIGLSTQIGSSVSSITGFDPGSPYDDWQLGDISVANACQAKSNTFGFKLSGAANNNCSSPAPKPCGMHHFVRLSGGTNNRPWSSSFGSSPDPALTFGLTTRPHTSSGGSTFGYFCPIFQDVTANPSKYIEYCFVEWRSSSSFPSSFPAINQYDDLGECQSTNPPYTPADVDIVFTAFKNDLNWGTHRAGSTPTFTFTQTSAYQTASITKQNLSNVITRLNTTTPDGCNRGLSTNLDNYALVGYEHGVEGAEFSSLGASVSGVTIKTTTDTLFTGKILGSGQTMYSPSNNYRIVMQGDGNLVIYNQSNQWTWQSYTNGHPGAFLEMQPDGNLVIYNSARTTALWAKPGTNYSAGSYANIRDDGVFVVYNGNQAKWWSN